LKAQKIDRILVNAIPLSLAIIGIISTLLIGESENVTEAWNDILSSLLGTWGTLFGFMIAAVSVLLTFNDGIFITILKKSGHYKTILLSYTFCCVHLFVALVTAFLFVLYQVSGKVAYAFLVGLSLDIILIVGICLCFLYKIAKKVE